ncbi:MAG: A/G-specific adenine glycosylase [Lachnospiraceae bacterium]|nr:A/G-specific adenine glycosylase [Lachnospiraceae bacterium]
MVMFKEDSPIKALYQSLPVLERQGEELSEEARLKAINGPLLSWYPAHARELPWRRDRNPYRIWISEIMLQQTRVEAVKPYFERFMKALPDIKALAEVEEDALLKLWEGLGYYSRARNLKKAAVMIQEEYGGRMPESYEELLKLPGIGSYTAGAVASIAFGIPVPAVDGNVMRVISRLLGSFEDITRPQTKKRLEILLKQTMDQHQAGFFNQGLFEVGALVCIPNGAPKCSECPLSSVCIARQKGLWDEIPVKPVKKARRIEEKTVLVIVGRKEEPGKAEKEELREKEAKSQNVVALKKRPPEGLLASLYEFPNVEGKLLLETSAQAAAAAGVAETAVEAFRPIGEAKHIFSHVEWHMTGYLIQVTGALPETFISADIRELEGKYPVPNAFLAYRKALSTIN